MLSADGDKWLLEEYSCFLRLEYPGLSKEVQAALNRNDEADISIFASKVRAMLTARSSAAAQLESPKRIPTEFRTCAMSKRKAAKLLGRPNPSSGTRWITKCIEDGTITCEQINRQTFFFDRRQFPDAVNNSI